VKLKLLVFLIKLKYTVYLIAFITYENFTYKIRQFYLYSEPVLSSILILANFTYWIDKDILHKDVYGIKN